MENCNLTTNTPLNQGEDPCNGQYKSTECVRESNALTELGIAANSTQQEINQAIQNAIFNLQPNTSQVEVLKVRRTLTAAEFIAIDTTPIEVIPAPGVGKFLNIVSIFGRLSFNTVAFDAFQLAIKHNSTSFAMAFLADLTETSNALIKGSSGNAGSSVIKENEALQIASAGVAPTVGDSTIDIYITYEIITL